MSLVLSGRPRALSSSVCLLLGVGHGEREQHVGGFVLGATRARDPRRWMRGCLRSPAPRPGQPAARDPPSSRPAIHSRSWDSSTHIGAGISSTSVALTTNSVGLRLEHRPTSTESQIYPFTSFLSKAQSALLFAACSGFPALCNCDRRLAPTCSAPSRA
jgi:hypothetical protein